MAEQSKPANYWGDMPEEEFYSSQGIKHSSQYFDTPNGKIFTQSFLPLNQSPKAIVCLTHGYGSDAGWLFQSLAILMAQWGYGAFTADLLGHGRSEGIHGYVYDVHKFAETSLLYFKSVRDSSPYKDLPRFLFGESMGGGITLLMHLQDPEGWDGIILSAPLIMIPDGMKPSLMHLYGYRMLMLGFADSWAVMPENNIVRKAIRDPERGKLIGGNPRRYTGKPRVGTMRELVGMCAYLMKNLEKVKAPFLVMHGTDDVVADPTASQELYNRAQSQDKTLKLYDGMRHSLFQGESEENRTIITSQIKLWLDQHV